VIESVVFALGGLVAGVALQHRHDVVGALHKKLNPPSPTLARLTRLEEAMERIEQLLRKESA
jgi:hypothetical protein